MNWTKWTQTNRKSLIVTLLLLYTLFRVFHFIKKNWVSAKLCDKSVNSFFSYLYGYAIKANVYMIIALLNYCLGAVSTKHNKWPSLQKMASILIF